MALGDTCDGRDHLARRTETALEGVEVNERSLHSVQLLAIRKPLDRRHLATISSRRQHHTRVHTHTL